MPVLDQYGNPIEYRRKFASGANRQDRSMQAMPIFDADFSKLIPNLDRKTIVSAARAIFQDYGPITGALIQKADHVVGRAWSPKFQGEDKEWGAEAKQWLEGQWYGNCDIRGRSWDFKTLLWLDCVAMDRDGDYLIVLTESESGYPLTQRISANRIGQRCSDDETVQSGPFRGAKISHGVIVNKFGRPLAFRILGDTVDDDVDMPANRVVHGFDPLWHDQVRGIPSYSGAIKMVFGSMTAHEREQMNQNVRSSISLIEYNENGGPDFDNPNTFLGDPATADVPQQPTVEHYGAGMIKYFRSNSGGKLDTVDNNQPGDMWDRFQDRVVRMSSSGINWPYELIWKGGEINSALVRNIQERARISVEDRQDVLHNPAVFTIRYAIAKAMKLGLISKPKSKDDWWKWSFQMPRKFSIDQGRDAAQRRDDFRAGLRNRTEIHEEEGKDPEVMENERIAEVVRREEKIDQAVADYKARTGKAIDRRHFYMLTPNDQPIIAGASTGNPEPSQTEPPDSSEPSEAAKPSSKLDFSGLKAKFDAYGVAVRSGSITPSEVDEEAFRKEADLPPMSKAVKGAWKEDKGFRRPITLLQKGMAAMGMGGGSNNTKNEDDQES